MSSFWNHLEWNDHCKQFPLQVGQADINTIMETKHLSKLQITSLSIILTPKTSPRLFSFWKFIGVLFNHSIICVPDKKVNDFSNSSKEPQAFFIIYTTFSFLKNCVCRFFMEKKSNFILQNFYSGSRSVSGKTERGSSAACLTPLSLSFPIPVFLSLLHPSHGMPQSPGTLHPPPPAMQCFSCSPFVGAYLSTPTSIFISH